MPTPKELAKSPKILISEEKLQARISEIAHDISRDFKGKEVVAICILKGSFIFFSDLIRKLDLTVSCEFLGLSSYGNETVSSGEVKVTLDLNEPLEGKHVIVIEDIVDSGLTLNYIMKTLGARSPATLKSCALLLKPGSLKVPAEPDYVGFKLGSEFVVGYGMDLAGKLRGLPYIGYIEHDH
jgi:hypoxanthine phosphoribosyltransferase